MFLTVCLGTTLTGALTQNPKPLLVRRYSDNAWTCLILTVASYRLPICIQQEKSRCWSFSRILFKLGVLSIVAVDTDANIATTCISETGSQYRHQLTLHIHAFPFRSVVTSLAVSQQRRGTVNASYFPPLWAWNSGSRRDGEADHFYGFPVLLNA